MAIILILSQLIVEYLKDPFLDLCCFCYILINDLPNTSKLLNVHLFVDDTCKYFSRKNLIDLNLILNQELLAVASLSILKTNFVIFHSKRLKPYIKSKN